MHDPKKDQDEWLHRMARIFFVAELVASIFMIAGCVIVIIDILFGAE